MSNLFKNFGEKISGSKKKSKCEDDHLARERAEKAAIPIPEAEPRQNDLEFRVALVRGRPDEQKPVFIALARLLLPDRVHLAEHATGYSYDLLKKEIEIQMNKLYGDHEVDTKHGFFSYFENDGLGLPTIKDQDSFEVGLNHLYHRRRETEVTTLIFQPEREEVRLARVAEEEELARLNRELEKDEALAERDRQLAHERELAEEKEAQISQEEYEAKFRQIQAGSQEPGFVIGIKSSNTQLHSPPPSEGVSRSTSQSELQGSDTGRGTPVVTPRSSPRSSRETPEDRAVRFKTLWDEKERVLFQKGGDGRTEQEVASKIRVDENADEDEGMVAEVEEEDEDDEIAQEDIAVVKLRALLDMPELAQLQTTDCFYEDNMDRWKECCKMFGIDPDKTGIDERVTVAGLKTRIYQYQAFGV
ncbi:hypothetical protein D0Z07_5774 [Hyphodiscus hymeniophilus]|uniref:Uncharacterized protein n=1 Tax=Hyphodiscus hymeniophilus TaxID=353542 RepID=A0A9P6VH92_9HELO|nr:hypothetical protein D0Z07_5774 [Hyphodiscus hymeniophilus]